MIALAATTITARAQTAFISDAWWTFQQDCNGDGRKAGTLPGNKARLNWDSDVTNCDGTLTVYEIVYSKPCASSTWAAIYTNAPHTITGCRSVGNSPSADISMGTNGTCRDYKIEVYRNGQGAPDYVRSGTNDTDLAQHQEQALSDDFCASDFFASCVTLNGSVGSQSDNNSFATKEPGEPNHAGNAGGHSLWYCWTPTNNATANFDTIGSTFDTLLAVYTGNSVSNLSLVVSNDDIAGATNRQSKVSFVPTPGVTYHIAVDGFGGATGELVLNWNQTGTALPDLIIWGPSVSPLIVQVTFASNDCAVVEGCELPGTRRLLSWSTELRNIGTGDLVVGDPSTNKLFVWANCHQHWHFEQFAEYHLLDTNMNVVTNAFGHKVGFCIEDVNKWNPSAPPLKYNCNFQGIQAGWADVYPGYDTIYPVACQYMDITDVAPGSYILQLIVNPAALIQESNFANNTTLVAVNIPPVSGSCPSAPPNDNFANGTVVTTTPWSSSEFNNCATGETGEPDFSGHASRKSVWFNWTPASNQTAVVTTKKSDFDTLLAVYTGNSLGSLSLVASNDDIIPNVWIQSAVSFNATAGTTYHIWVDGYSNSFSSGTVSVGTVVLNVNPAGNDDFANAYTISGVAGTTNSYLIGASKEFHEPAHGGDVGGHSIWYKWIAPSNGPVDVNTIGSDFDTTLAVYTGTVVTNLTVVASNDDDPGGQGAVTSRLWFNAAAGTTYRIAVDGFGGVIGHVKLNWNMNCNMSITGKPGGGPMLVMTGVQWQRYSILESTNLKTWATNTVMTMSGDQVTYTDPDGEPFEFYRMVILPP